jgi:hypothetical protein
VTHTLSFFVIGHCMLLNCCVVVYIYRSIFSLSSFFRVGLKDRPCYRFKNFYYKFRKNSPLQQCSPTTFNNYVLFCFYFFPSFHQVFFVFFFFLFVLCVCVCFSRFCFVFFLFPPLYICNFILFLCFFFFFVVSFLKH